MLSIRSYHVPLLAYALVVAGCGGGGSPPANVRAGGPSPSSFGRSNASATIVIRPGVAAKRAARAHKRAYVSGATQGAIATFVDANGTAYEGYTLTAGAVASASSPATCTAVQSGSYSCTLYFVLDPAGSPYQTTITTYDAAQSGTSGTPAAASDSASAVAISTDTEPLTIVANQNNPFSFTLQGIVEAFATTPQYIGVNGTAQSMASPAPVFQALDGDAMAIDTEDTTSNFAVGTQPSGPFTENASFAVGALDENGCSSAPCIATTATAVSNPSSESVPYSYNGLGSGGDGVSIPPYYGVLALSTPTAYSGSTVQVGSASYASVAYVVPFFGFVDTTSPFATDATDVSFVSPSNSITVYAAQYHAPDNATGYAADTSSCGSGATAIATASGPSPNPGYGALFTLSAGSSSGTCSVVLSDGAGDSATIAVTSIAGGNSTVIIPCSAPTALPNYADRARGVRKTGATTACPSPSPTQSAIPL